MRVGVFMGGKSVENEVSFNSGRTVCDHLDASAYDIIPVFQRSDGALFILPWNFLHRGKITDFEHRLESQAQKIGWDDLKATVDFMFLAIHGRYAEDGILQGFLEILGIPYMGSGILTSALCMDKSIQKDILTANGFHVPKGITLTPYDIAQGDENAIITMLNSAGVVLPCIVKPYKEGSSLGISVVHTKSDLLSAIQKACHTQPDKPQSVIIEEKIVGMEFSCIIIEDYKTEQLLPLPPTEIIPEANSHFFDYEQKYMPGRATKFTPARCTQDQIKAIQETCSNVMKLLEIKTIARIDGFLQDNNRIVIIDPNTLSGMGPTSFVFRQAAELGMGHTAVINHIIETELYARGMLNHKGIS